MRPARPSRCRIAKPSDSAGVMFLENGRHWNERTRPRCTRPIASIWVTVSRRSAPLRIRLQITGDEMTKVVCRHPFGRSGDAVARLPWKG